MIYVRFSIISLLFFALIGCNAINKKMSTADEYTHSGNHDKVLSLPKEMQKIKINDSYPVPIAGQASTDTKSAHILTLPPGSRLTK